MTGSEIADSAKNAGVVLTVLSSAAYACGYLVGRARARALGVAMLLWFAAHFARAGGLDPVGAALLLIGTLLLVLLPMQHGVFHADRTARQLDRIPEGVTGLAEPIWLVDRGTSDRVVL